MSPELLAALILVGITGGVIAGLGGPGGIPVLLTLDLVLGLPAATIVATASTIFTPATVTATGLYRHSDGIEWRLAAAVALPAFLGITVGTRLSPHLTADAFDGILAAVMVLAAVGIWYRESRVDGNRTGDWRNRRTLLGAVIGSLCVGVLAGLTGVGGPALVVPWLLVLGVSPVAAIGAALASGVVITAGNAATHALAGMHPSLPVAAAVGVPYVVSQVVGWRFVHWVSERAVSYTIAAVAVLGAVAITLL